jgi:hypothetical protein
MKRIATVCAIVIGAALIGAAQADVHHGAHDKIKGKGDGKHEVHKTKDGHVCHAHVKNGKVHNLTVAHATHTADQLKLKKVKTKTKRHAMNQAPDGIHLGQGATAEHHYVSTEPAQVTVWVGWAFFNPIANHWVFIWFPITIVEGGDQGCQDIDSGT